MSKQIYTTDWQFLAQLKWYYWKRLQAHESFSQFRCVVRISVIGSKLTKISITVKMTQNWSKCIRFIRATDIQNTCGPLFYWSCVNNLKRSSTLIQSPVCSADQTHHITFNTTTTTITIKVCCCFFSLQKIKTHTLWNCFADIHIVLFLARRSTINRISSIRWCCFFLHLFCSFVSRLL